MRRSHHVVKQTLAVFRRRIVSDRKKNSFVDRVVHVSAEEVDEQELAEVQLANPSVETFVLAFGRQLENIHFRVNGKII